LLASSGRPQARNVNLMRDPATTGPVTNIELFFDLVYVFAVTQLSHYLLAHPTSTGALRAGLLLIMAWLLWAYTTWVTNWLDPERIAVRLLLLGLAGASLAMSAGLLAATRRAGRARAAGSGRAARHRARAGRLHDRRDHRGRRPGLRGDP